MDSSILKTEALCWLRFGKKLPYICTEGGYWSSDVLGVNKEFSVEVEVKISVADLKREFVTKTAKHHLFANAASAARPPRGTPNYFYFYVPKEMEQAALEIVKEKAPKAGLAVYEPHGWLMDGKKTSVVHRPTKLHDDKPTPHFIDVVVRRMGSELCGRYTLQQRFLAELGTNVRKLYDALPKLMERVAQTPDFEETDGSSTSSSQS
jgi:hypothetical protein